MKKLFITMVVCAFALPVFAKDATPSGTFDLIFEAKSKKSKSTSKARAAKARAEEASYTFACDVKINNITDQRSNKETIGASFYVPLRAQKVDDWANDFKIYAQKILDSRSVSKGTGKKLEIDADLFRMYSYSQAMSIRGVVALKLDLVGVEDEEAIVVRGYSSKTNWASKREEYGTAVNLAAVNLVDNMSLVIQDLCGSENIE